MGSTDRRIDFPLVAIGSAGETVIYAPRPVRLAVVAVTFAEGSGHLSTGGVETHRVVRVIHAVVPVPYALRPIPDVARPQGSAPVPITSTAGAVNPSLVAMNEATVAIASASRTMSCADVATPTRIATNSLARAVRCPPRDGTELRGMALTSAVMALTSAVSRLIVAVVYDDLRSVSDELVASAGRLARCDQ